MMEKELHNLIYDFMMDNELEGFHLKAQGQGVNLITEITIE